MPKQRQTFLISNRILTLDAMRGIIIILMALDHANDFIAQRKLQPELWADFFPNYQGHPPTIFITRFITHLAAPGFFFLMGMGMVMFASSRLRKGWSWQKIALHFLIRGTSLIILQFTLENLAWSLKDPVGTYFGVLFGLGGVMIIGILLLFLGQRSLILICCLLILGTTILLPQQRTGFVEYPVALRMLYLPGFTGNVLVLYPILSWLGVAGLGMAFGRFFEKNPAAAYRLAFWLGYGSLLVFTILRKLGGFGSIRPPSADGWIAFLNVVKYPPSTTFLLLTLGSLLLLLSLISRIKNRYLWPVAVFGRVPLFFYLSHLFFYGLLGLTVVGENGLGIVPMLPYWILGLIVLWPFCLYYGSFKQSRSQNSIWRFF